MKKAIRTSSINIDTIVPGGVQWINADVQRLEIDDSNNITSLSPRQSKLHRRIDEVALETVTITDPITGETSKISVAEIGIAIEAIITKWLVEDNKGYYYDKKSGRVILDASS